MGIRSALAFAAIAAVLHGVVDVNADWPRPAVGMGWQWELTFNAVPDVTTPNVPVWDVDPEQLDSTDIPTLMNDLHANDRYIICYVNVGALDTGKSDASQFTAVTPTIVGNEYPGWPNEYFLDIRRSETRALIKGRFERMASYGCHAIEPDNLDSYLYNTFAPTAPNLTLSDTLDYLDWISTTVHNLGMAVGLKNCGDLVATHNLASIFDFAVVESCAEFPGDCAKYNPFIQAGKPVFAAEYTDVGSGGCSLASSMESACSATNAANIEGIIKACGLGPEYQACQTYDLNGYRTAP
ncbi:Glycoside-hydrolase family GH114 TIM-barrel domain-containing protein [Plasmodiophora brassicae]